MLLLWLFKLLIQSPISFLIACIYLIVPLLISISIHEWAHGFVAYKFGDPTPKNQGRLTLNPFAHLDLVGTLMLFIIGIGWAKPVMINPNNIKGRTKQLLVALAGPASNFSLAFIVATIILILNSNHIPPHSNHMGSVFHANISLLGVVVKINLLLGVFNLMPIPPLDGANIFRWVLPNFLLGIYSKIEKYGFIILLVILFTKGFGFIFYLGTMLETELYKVIQSMLHPFFN